jgi:hypothetical protein
MTRPSHKGSRAAKRASRRVERSEKAKLAAKHAEETLQKWMVATTKEFITGVQLLLRYWNFPSVLLSEVERQIRSFLALEAGESGSDLISRLKWLCAYPMAKLCREPIERIRQPFSFTGKLRPWFRAHSDRRSVSNYKLWFSWFHLKRCTETVPDVYVKMCPKALERDVTSTYK